MNEEISSEIDYLEHEFIEKGCDVTQLAVAFSEYLLFLLKDGRVRVNSSALDSIEGSLSRSATFLDVTENAKNRQP